MRQTNRERVRTRETSEREIRETQVTEDGYQERAEKEVRRRDERNGDRDRDRG